MISRRMFLAAPVVLGCANSIPCQTSQWSPMRTAIPDTPVLDQHGRQLRFYSDLVAGRTVAMNFVFTTCTTICTPLTAIFREVQKDTAHEPVHLISISVDPESDQPEILAQFAKKFEAGPNWTFVTGQPSDIDDLLRSLEAFTIDKLGHTPLVLIGNEPANRWTRITGFSPVPVLAATLRDAAKFKKASA